MVWSVAIFKALIKIDLYLILYKKYTLDRVKTKLKEYYEKFSMHILGIGMVFLNKTQKSRETLRKKIDKFNLYKM